MKQATKMFKSGVMGVLLALGFIVSHPVEPTTGFLLDLEPCVDIVLEQPLARFKKVPDLTVVLDLVSHGYGFLEVGCAPYTLQSPLVVRMRTPVGSNQGSFGNFVLQKACTQGEGQFSCITVRQHGMVRLKRLQHFKVDHAKIEGVVCVTRLRDELRMAFLVEGCLVYPRVQGGVINVTDLFSWFCMVV